VVGSEFVVVDVVHEHVPDRGEQGVLDGHDGALFAASGGQVRRERRTPQPHIGIQEVESTVVVCEAVTT